MKVNTLLRSAVAFMLTAAMFFNTYCAGDVLDEQTDDAITASISALQGNGAWTPVSSFGSNPGQLKMNYYAPPTAPANAPLVVAFHGCSQTASAYEPTGWTNLADEWEFYVIFPEQDSGNNPALCFNWAGEYGDETNLIRNQGENKSVISMVNYMKANFSIDDNRIFTVGFSAGGAMVPVMLATWPDVFKGGAIHAGVPYRCATSVNGAFDCMSPGRSKTPQQWGDLVRGAFPSFSGTYPKVSIWHGSSDTTVVPANQNELIKQWTNVHGIDQTADVNDSIDGYAREQFQNGSGETLVESIVIPGMGHSVPIDPQTSYVSGCGQTGAYIDDRDICAAYHIGKFFGLDNSDQVAPTVAITSPANGAGVSGTVNVDATASDDVGVERVELYVDGSLKDTDTAAPYSLSFDATQVYNGSRIVEVKAFDAAGNMGSDSINVTVSGGLVDTTPPVITASPGGGTFTGTINVALSSNETADIYYTTDGSTPTTSSAVYTSAIVVSDTTTLKFFGVDTSANTSAVTTEQYDKLSYEEEISGTCTTHYVAGRLDSAGYTQCGSTYGYIDEVTMYRFGTCWSFDIAGAGCDPGNPGDTTPPSVNVTAPSGGATISGTISITASASDNVGVTSVSFYVNGSLVGTDTSAPYSVSFDSTSVADGTVSISATASDAAGNSTTDNDTSVTVDNGGQPPPNCDEQTTYNYYHKTAGRAYSTGNPWSPNYFAQGSDDPMNGSTWGTTTLNSTDGGSVWNVGSCP